PGPPVASVTAVSVTSVAVAPSPSPVSVPTVAPAPTVRTTTSSAKVMRPASSTRARPGSPGTLLMTLEFVAPTQNNDPSVVGSETLPLLGVAAPVTATDSPTVPLPGKHRRLPATQTPLVGQSAPVAHRWLSSGGAQNFVTGPSGH